LKGKPVNLISCDTCGVVLDKDKLKFPEDISDDEGIVSSHLAVWTGDKYVPYVNCPLCNSPILGDKS
jgi:hypothetical protein